MHYHAAIFFKNMEIWSNGDFFVPFAWMGISAYFLQVFVYYGEVAFRRLMHSTVHEL